MVFPDAKLVLLLAATHLFLTDGQVISNPSFEDDIFGWTISGTAARDANASPFQNGDGAFHAQITGSGSFIEQAVTGLTVGTSYRARLLAASNSANAFERVRVDIDGVSHWRQLPRTFIRIDVYFIATAASVILKLTNLSPSGSANKIVRVDDVSIVAAEAPPLSPLDNPSFEVDVLTPDQSYLYTSPHAWEAEGGGTVLVRNTIPTVFPNPNWGGLSSGVGEFYASLQSSGSSLGGNIYDLVPGATYRVQFVAAGRPNSPGGTAEQRLHVSIDGAAIFSRGLPHSSFRLYSAEFQAAEASAYIKFENQSPIDGTVVVDDTVPCVGAGAVSFTDSFTADAPDRQMPTELTNWNVVAGTVDVAMRQDKCMGGVGDYCIDLEGYRSSGKRSKMETKESFAVEAGQRCVLSVSVSGNRWISRDDDTQHTATFSFGGDLSESVSLNADPWATKSWAFTVSKSYSGPLTVEHVTTTNNGGVHLDNVHLSCDAGCAPTDKSVFVDAVSLSRGDASEASGLLLGNPSFEDDDLYLVFTGTATDPARAAVNGTVAQHYAYMQPKAWTRAGSTVVAYNKNSEWGLSPSWGAFDSNAGRNFAVLQRRGAALSQIITGLLPGRTYTLAFLAARRPNSPGGDAEQRLHVKVDGSGTLAVDFKDSFTADAPHRQKPAELTNWNVVAGTVDVAMRRDKCMGGVGDYCIDLEGYRSSGKRSKMETKESFAVEAGQRCVLSVSVSGNRWISRDDDTQHTATFSFGGDLSESVSLNADPWATKSWAFTVSKSYSGPLTVEHVTTTNNGGVHLDNVRFTCERVGFVPPHAFTAYAFEFTPSGSSVEIAFENASPDAEADKSVFLDALSITRPAVCTIDHDYELKGHCWKVVRSEGALDHAAAAASCNAWGGELASIGSGEDNDALLRRAQAVGWAGAVWIGAQREEQSTWAWPDGSTATEGGAGFAEWGAGQPDNELEAGAHCAVMEGDGTWRAVLCAEAAGSVAACKTPAVACDVMASGYCYSVRHDPQTRQDGASVCMAWGGTLATIPDDTAEAKLGVFLSASGLGAPAWVGARRLMTGGAWAWDDSAPAHFLNFQSASASALDSGLDAGCAVADPLASATLLASPCAAVTSPFICSRRLRAPCKASQPRTASSGIIGDGHSHPDQECEWVIEPATTAVSITLAFSRLDIEDQHDFVYVYGRDDALVATYTGTGHFPLPQITVQSARIRVVFRTDWAVQNAGGFEAQYRATTVTCLSYPCDDRSTCAVAQDGTFACTCLPGFAGNGDLTSGGAGCGDVNECQSGSVPYPCAAHASCNNTVGSATCTCEQGYAGDAYAGGGCVNVNECAGDLNPCHGNATCTDTAGAYNCTCLSGYVGDGEESCEDIDECEEGAPCDANADCENLPGTFSCACRAGWMGDGFPGECFDVDECAPGAASGNTCDKAHGVCHNLNGSYACSCERGWTASDDADPASAYGNGSACFDADECAFEADNCDPDAACDNTEGSFACGCPPGFAGDGLACAALCSEEAGKLCHALAYCQDETCLCPEGIVGSGAGVDGCDRNAWALRFAMRLPWVTAADRTPAGKLRAWDAYLPAYVALLTAAPPPGFSTSVHHELEVFDAAAPGGLLTVSALWPVEAAADAEAARARLQALLDADAPPTAFGVQLAASQTSLAAATARRALDNETLLIVGSYPVEPRVYSWVAATTSAEVRVLPTGLSVDSLVFEPSCKASGCWVARIKYTTGEDNFNVLYLPNAQTADEAASFDFDYDVPMNANYAMTALDTFTVSNFPCGSNDYVPDPATDIPRKVTGCCIPEFVQLYRPVRSFVSEVASKVTAATCDAGVVPYFLPASYMATSDAVTYTAKPSNALAGHFLGMEHAEVVFTGVLDPFLKQYTAVVYLDEVELRSKAGMLRGTVAVEHTVDTFIGLANFKPTGLAFLDAFATQVNLHLEKTSFFSVSTHGTNDYTFLEYINLRLVAIYEEDSDPSETVSEDGERTSRTDSAGDAGYVQVSFTMGQQYEPNLLSGGLLPLDSVRAGIGTFFDDIDRAGGMEHVCVGYAGAASDAPVGLAAKQGLKAAYTALLAQDCAPQAAMCASPAATPDSFVSFNIPLGFDVFDGLESTDLSNNVFVHMVVSAVDTSAAGNTPNAGDDPLQMKTTLFATIPIVAGGINIFCDGITAKTDLKDVADADILFGTASNATEMGRLRILEDIASSDLSPVAPPAFTTPSIEAGLMTLVVKGSSAYFGRTGGAGAYALQVEDVVTVHVMEGPAGTRLRAVRALLALAGDDNYDTSTLALRADGYSLNGAFGFTTDRATNRAHLEPSAELLALCPFNPPRPSASDAFPTTCVSRRDIQARAFPARTGAAPTATEVQPLRDAPLGAEVPAGSAARNANGEFMQEVLGASAYAFELGKTFGFVLGQRYELNGQYNRAFWINPGYEWTPTQTGGASRFQVSQSLLVFALITLDEGFAARRRALLTDVSGTGAGLAAAEVTNDVSPATVMASAFGVPAHKVASYKVVMALSAEEACMEAGVLKALLRAELEGLLAAAASKLRTVQLLSMAVDARDVRCRRRSVRVGGRRLLAAARADTEMLVVFDPEVDAMLDASVLAKAERVVGIEALDVPEQVASTALDLSPDATENETGGDGGFEHFTLVVAVCAGVGGLCVVGLCGVLWTRMRARKPTEEAVPLSAIKTGSGAKVDTRQLMSEARGESETWKPAEARPMAGDDDSTNSRKGLLVSNSPTTNLLGSQDQSVLFNTSADIVTAGEVPPTGLDARKRSSGSEIEARKLSSEIVVEDLQETGGSTLAPPRFRHSVTFGPDGGEIPTKPAPLLVSASLSTEAEGRRRASTKLVSPSHSAARAGARGSVFDLITDALQPWLQPDAPRPSSAEPGHRPRDVVGSLDHDASSVTVDPTASRQRAKSMQETQGRWWHM